MVATCMFLNLHQFPLSQLGRSFDKFIVQMFFISGNTANLTIVLSFIMTNEFHLNQLLNGRVYLKNEIKMTKILFKPFVI